MTLPPAFLAYLQQPAAAGVGIQSEPLVAMDLFVMINLAFLFFMLGFFACWAWLIWRRTTKPEPHIQLIMEMQEFDGQPERQTSSPSYGNDRAPWQRKSDWWKN